MKKLVIFAALATMSISGSAMAVQENIDRDIEIDGDPAGTASFDLFSVNGLGDPVLAPNGTCLYNMTWTDPDTTNPQPDRICRVRETKTRSPGAPPPATPCPSMDRNTTMFAGAGFNTRCSGFNQFGRAFGPQGGSFFSTSASLVLGESAAGTPSISGTIRDPFFPTIIQSITIE